MSLVMNKISCVSDQKNTGKSKCFLDIKNIVGMIKPPTGKELTPADIADIEATLRAGILAPKAERFYPGPRFEQLTDGSEDVTLQTFGYGTKAFVRDGDMDWTFQFVEGGYCLLAALSSHNNAKGDFLFVDADGKIYGTTLGVKTKGNMKGIPSLFRALPWKVSDGSNATIYAVRFIFRPQFVNDSNLAFIDPAGSFDMSTLDGLQDIILKEVSGSTDDVLKLSATTGCDKLDLGTLFESELETVGNWVGKTSGGSTLTPTSVAYAASVDGGETPGVFTVTFASSVATVTLKPAADLSTAGIDGFEANVLAVTPTP